MIAKTESERLRDREPQALQSFFDEHFDSIHNYVRKHVRDEHRAEDLTQDIFLHAYRGLPRYDPEKSVKPWLFTIAANKVRDSWRSLQRQESRGEKDIDERAALIPDVMAGPRDLMLRSEERSLLRRAIASLPETLRETLILRVDEGMSFEAIARIVGRNVAAVRKRYSRALKALRDLHEGPTPIRTGSR